jgi:ATP-dependent Clp protease protease subunit
MLKIEIYNDISFNTSAKEIQQLLTNLSQEEQIELSINSNGGDVIEGLEIYNLLSSYKEKLTTTILGTAVGTASFIALAGKKILMHEKSYIMLCEARILASNNSNKDKEVLSKINSKIAALYKTKINLSIEEIIQSMQEETWYSASQAEKIGFCDEII